MTRHSHLLRLQAPGLVLCVALLFGCEMVSTETAVEQLGEVAAPSFSRDIAPFLAQTCAASGACHFGPGAQQGLELSEDSSYANLVNQPSSCCGVLVNPGDDAGSFLIRVMSTDSGVRGYPWRMPLTERPVPPEVQQTIRNWIVQGALDN